jgi:hypothetical protein
MISSMTRFGATALLAGGLLSSAVPAEAAHLACKPAIFGVGRGTNMDIAMNHAIENWRMKTASSYGGAYINWYNTLDRGRHCNGKSELIYCRVWANPCR